MTECSLMTHHLSTFITPQHHDHAEVIFRIIHPSRVTNLFQSAEDEHVYTNVEEMAAINNRVEPPTPEEGDEPLREVNGGWKEYRTKAGRFVSSQVHSLKSYSRSYFHHAESGRSQWNPPRFLRSPKEVKSFMDATEMLHRSDTVIGSYGSPLATVRFFLHSSEFSLFSG